MKKPILGAFENRKSEAHMLGSLQKIHLPMRRFSESDEIDYVIVGCGAAGGVLLQRLARSGFRVMALEAGPFWDTERDWVSRRIGIASTLLGRSPRHWREESSRAGCE